MSRSSIAVKIVKTANALLAKKFQTLGLSAVRLKKNEEIVTEVDLVSNTFITKQLLKHFPGDNIISEEVAPTNNPGEKTWFIDPLDGTSNFAYGLPMFAVCLALTAKQQIELGIIGLPLAHEVYSAQKNEPAYLNGKKIHVSSTFNHGSRAMIFLCGGHSPAGQNKFRGILKKLDISRFRFRVIGSAGVELAAVASGRADGCIMTDIHPWDVLAGTLLVRGAGGKVTNFAGRDWKMGDTQIIASNGLIHSKLLHLVK